MNFLFNENEILDIISSIINYVQIPAQSKCLSVICLLFVNKSVNVIIMYLFMFMFKNISFGLCQEV